MEAYDKIKKEYDTFKVDYDKSMVEGEETSFPITSTYSDSANHDEIEDWVWCRRDANSDTFAFDSDAEREWASFLAKISSKSIAEVEQLDDEERYLWGKNFPHNSEIKYEYYSNGVHKSFPDFVMKDKKGRIHVFEVKCLNGSGKAGFSEEEYKEKVEKLMDCYLYCSKILKNHVFHIPIKKGETWDIWSYENGAKENLNKDQFKLTLK
jgi:type III restriction enzyme